MALMKMYQKAWTSWLDAVDSGFDLFLKSPVFVLGAGKLIEGSNRLRTKRVESAEKFLAETRVASKDDVDRLAADTHKLEAKLNEVLLRLDEQARPKAPNLGVEIGSLEVGLAEILARVSLLETSEAVSVSDAPKTRKRAQRKVAKEPGKVQAAPKTPSKTAPKSSSKASASAKKTNS